MSHTKARFDRINKLCDELYQYEFAGGPLHIITDDGNVKDSHLVFCYRELNNNLSKYNHNTVVLSLTMLYELMMLTECQRHIWWQIKDVDPAELADKAVNGEAVYIEGTSRLKQIIVRGEVIWEADR